MRSTQPGERLAVGLNDACTIRIGGRNADRITVAAVSPQGAFQPLERGSAAGEWKLSDIADLGEKAEILIYITDDRTGGFVNESYPRSEEHTSELQSLMRISYAVFCLKKKNNI